MKMALAILAMILGTLSHLSLIFLCLVGMANASDQQLREIRLWMLAIALAAIGTILAGVVLLRWGYPWTVVLVSLATAVGMWIVVFKATTP